MESMTSSVPEAIDSDETDEYYVPPPPPPPPTQRTLTLQQQSDSEDLIIVRGDGTLPGEKPKLPSRPPFTLHDYDEEGHSWIVPADENLSLAAQIETGYERARVSNMDGPLMRSRSVFDMVTYALNPDGEELTAEEVEAIRAGVVEFKRAQALHVDEEMEISLAFLDKGAPFRFIKNLLITLRAARRDPDEPGRRRLEAGEGKRHLEGLWEHEVGVDRVPTAQGFVGRKLLKAGF